MEETKQGLKRTMGFFPALATVMGTVIGGGVFFKAAAVAADTGSASLHMFAWFLGGVISVCAGLTGAELAAAIPETGGMVKYIERTYGGMAGFLLGWAQVLIYMPANVAALAIIFGTQFVNLFGLGTNLIVPIAIVTALIILLINFISAKAGGVFQSIALVMKLVPIALIVIVGLFFGNGHTVSIFPIVSGHGNSLLQGLGAGLLATMFAYDGWIHVGNIAGELKRPSKDLPRAIAFGIIAVMAVYLLVNYVFIKTIGFDEIYGALNTQLGSALPPTEVASRLFGDLGGKLVTIGILISVAGTVNGYTMTG
ncbi:MAG: amino acid permease, partial [Streptococcaceae bacterium]|nr:amino acid permease [Streptococcaceae bacterium]